MGRGKAKKSLGLIDAYVAAALAWLEREGWPAITSRKPLLLQVDGRDRSMILAPATLPGCIVLLDRPGSVIAVIPRPTLAAAGQSAEVRS